MRWIIGIGVAVALGLAGGAGGGGTGEAVPASIAFFDARTGLLGTQSTVEATGDGGRRWRVLFRARGPFAMRTAGEAAWALGKSGFWRSTDRGRSWVRLARPPGPVSFATPMVGWSVRSREMLSGQRIAVLFHTRDGGRTWERLGKRSLCAGTGFEHAAVSRVSQGRGWLLCGGQPGAGQMLKAVYRTEDGGRTWHLRACACGRPYNRGRLSSAGYAGAIEFTPAGFGVLLQHRGTPVSVSRDGGRTWQATKAGEVEVEYGAAASMPSDDVVYVLLEVGPPSRVLKVSRDGGRTWRVVRDWP